MEARMKPGKSPGNGSGGTKKGSSTSSSSGSKKRKRSGDALAQQQQRGGPAASHGRLVAAAGGTSGPSSGKIHLKKQKKKQKKNMKKGEGVRDDGGVGGGGASCGSGRDKETKAAETAGSTADSDDEEEEEVNGEGGEKDEQMVHAGEGDEEESGGRLPGRASASAVSPTGAGGGRGGSGKGGGAAAGLSFRSCTPALSKECLSAVDALGFSHMTPVQAATIPLFLRKKDVCVEAVTGSGKTLAFVIPLVEMILRRETPLKKHQIGAIIITPTRELAGQIFKVLKHFALHVEELKPVLAVGGTGVDGMVEAFQEKGANVLVGTPGRLDHLLGHFGIFNVKELEVLLLDEADTLLDMGFMATLSSILKVLPKQRRTGLFSATQTKQVKDLARAGLRNPTSVCVAVHSQSSNLQQATPSTLRNYYIKCAADEKLRQLVGFLRTHPDTKVIIFLVTCASVDFYSKVLEQLLVVQDHSNNDKKKNKNKNKKNKKKGEGEDHEVEDEDEEGDEEEGGASSSQMDCPVFALHGRMVQKRRAGVFQSFSSAPRGLLVCTDVAARGIDIPDVDWIVQFDPPTDPSFFVHRVGRTARAGRVGASLTLLTEPEDAYIEFLRRRGVPMEERDMFTDGEVSPQGPAQDPGTRVKQMVKSDRDLLEKGTRAFISFVRAYREHQCQFIFRFNELDLAAAARGFSLLKMPKIKELKDVNMQNLGFEEEAGLDTAAIEYSDKTREKARKKRLEGLKKEHDERRLQEASEGGKEAAKQRLKDKRREQKEKEEAIRIAKKTKKSKHATIMEEWDELALEERLHKRLRKGKISKKEYEAALRGEEVEEDEEEEGEEAEGGGG